MFLIHGEITPKKSIPAPENERFSFFGTALPACEHLNLRVYPKGTIIASCKNYNNRDFYCRDYPKHGTSALDPFYCIYDSWTIKYRTKFSRVPKRPNKTMAVKLFALDKREIKGHEKFIVGGFSLNRKRYYLIPIPLPPVVATFSSESTGEKEFEEYRRKLNEHDKCILERYAQISETLGK